VRFGNRSGQFWGPPQPIHRSGICSFAYSNTCQLKIGVPLQAGSISVIALCRTVIFNFYQPSTTGLIFKCHLLMGVTSNIRSWRTEIQSSDILINKQRKASDGIRGGGDWNPVSFATLVCRSKYWNSTVKLATAVYCRINPASSLTTTRPNLSSSHTVAKEPISN
jgi:hypothetical protein